MTLRIRLGALKKVQNHALGLSEIGFRPDLSERDYFDRGRGVWRLSADKVLAEDLLFVTSPAAEVLAVAEITGVTKYGDRRAVEANLIAGHPRCGTKLLVPHRSRNSVSYGDEDVWHTVAHARQAQIAGIQEAARHTLVSCGGDQALLAERGLPSIAFDVSGGWAFCRYGESVAGLQAVGLFGPVIGFDDFGDVDVDALRELAEDASSVEAILGDSSGGQEELVAAWENGGDWTVLHG